MASAPRTSPRCPGCLHAPMTYVDGLFDAAPHVEDDIYHRSYECPKCGSVRWTFERMEHGEAPSRYLRLAGQARQREREATTASSD